MSSEPRAGGRGEVTLVLVLTFVAMMAAGVVLALELVVAWPTLVLLAAVAVATVGLAVFFVAGWRNARLSGAGVFRALAGTVRGTIRSAIDLFF